MEKTKVTIRRPISGVLKGSLFFNLLLLLAFPAMVRAQQHEDFDQYKVRLDTAWFLSNPTGYIQGSKTGDSTSIDLQRDLGFNSYSTFAGKFDWKFTRKNHLYVAFIPLYSSHQTILNRTFTFQGKVFNAGLVAQSQLHAFLAAPGYQRDIIRRKRGHLGIGMQIDLFNSSAKISATGMVNGMQSSVSASGSILAPIPVGGPEFRLYLTNSPRVFVEGNVYGMYFGAYGSFVSTADALGVRLAKHINATFGFQLGSRLIVKNNNSSNRIGLRMTQQGAIAGLEFSL
jgi:hypothetical protein